MCFHCLGWPVPVYKVCTSGFALPFVKVAKHSAETPDFFVHFFILFFFSMSLTAGLMLTLGEGGKK